ncbi:MAG: hypothetical protein U0990_08135 [Candidatus Nanopelagicales bacterium]|nr:hypothetical protein [Candidatus Nanopelagicales bacterium]MDZ4250044.1 hypothetical protein [Candidatus Nanopelagicales bacterium]
MKRLDRRSLDEGELLVKIAMLSGGVLAGAGLGAAILVRRGTRWGATEHEQAMALPGDAYFPHGTQASTRMTRAISIAADPETVWPWVAQMGRGAGWYSYDRLDNGGIASARHIVSWIPEPRVGDAAAIGWLRDLEPGRGATWWVPGDDMLGATVRMVTDIRLDPKASGTRLVIRISGTAEGAGAAFITLGFEVVDSIMAVQQLKGIKARAETFGARTADPQNPETGERDQFQIYEAIWAQGGNAGVAGREHAARWREAAREAAVQG